MTWNKVEFKKWDGPQTIDIGRTEELAYWARAIQISENELEILVKEVGSNLQEIMRAVILRDIRRRNGYSDG